MRPASMRRWLRRAAVVAIAFLPAACALPKAGAPASTATSNLAPVAFSALPGWSADRPTQALRAFLGSCLRIALLPPDQALGGSGLAATLGGKAGQWQDACAAARAVPPADEAAARQFFETRLQPYRLSEAGRSQALFTGYFEPTFRGSRTRGGVYQTPILTRPADLVTADLGAFSAKFGGRHVTGRMRNGHLVPYYDRFQIEHGALAHKGLTLLWMASPIDAYFLQIEGAGRIRLPNGGLVRVGYAGQNGRPYVPIGRLMIKRKLLAPNQISMQSIRAYLLAHPRRGRQLMDQNPSYVFFKEIVGLSADQGPLGALGVPLMPRRSVAIDRAFIPLGAPVFVATTDPATHAPLQRMMVAQDIGSGVKGPLRADIFFGWGANAEAAAGAMDAPGTLYVLLPRPAATASAATSAPAPVAK